MYKRKICTDKISVPHFLSLVSRVYSWTLLLPDGGCTEGIATEITTDPTLPSGQELPVATPISDSYISIIWEPPLRPNGPNIRYELGRSKIRQPLDGERKILCPYSLVWLD